MSIPGVTEDDIRSLIQSLWLLEVTKYTAVASITFLVLEIISTTDQEVTYIWPSRWTAMKVIYLINRYSPLIDGPLGLSTYMGAIDGESFELRFTIVGYVYAAGTYFSEFILVARTLALYDFKRYICLGMSLLMVALIVPSLIYLHTYLSSVQYDANADMLRLLGRIPSGYTRPAWTLTACILISETVVVVLTIIKQLQSSSKGSVRSPLVRVMYRDGSYTYVVMLALTIANLCTMLLAPGPAQALLQMPLRVTHSVLCSRVLLNLRVAADHRQGLTFEHASHTYGHAHGHYQSQVRTLESGIRRQESNLDSTPTRIELAVEMETITKYDD
ncbi:hypothetical protein C8Q74DRAFT_1370122 [Fomes fomentarius]|nr:hypothetical protein C8Q74DRAFT_1370122 [Fomes fomentarius]